MTQERFIQILNDPALLAGISYEELKTLAMAYPSTHNMRVLLALKAMQINHPEFNKQLAAAAAHSLDRTRLFHLMAPEQLVPQPVAVQEEVLELKPIADLQKALDVKMPVEKKNTVKPAQRSIELEAAESKPVHSPLSEILPDNVIDSAENMPEITKPVLPLEREEVPGNGGHWIRFSQLPVLQRAANPAAGPEISAPSAPSFTPPPPEEEDFLPESDMTAPEATVETESTTKQGFSAQELAERSVKLKEEIASETLARLLARQGFKDKAIAMYEKLRLLFPEKSDYFAAEIQKLKK